MEKSVSFHVLIYFLLFGLSRAVRPTGVHISIGDDPISERVIQWASADIENITVLKKDGVVKILHNEVDYMKQPLVSAKTMHWIQRAILKNLTAGSTYEYKVGKNELYPILSFDMWKNTTKLGYHRSPMTFLFYGSIEDRDGVKAPADRLLEEKALFGHYNGVINLGALSCNRTLLHYLDSLQHVAGTTVYLTTPGPNERTDEYSMYSRLFSMPNVPWPMTRYWYSFNTEFAHLVSFTTEVYYPEVDKTRVDRQLEWLRNDLKEANDQRTGLPGSRPWIIAYSHRALYCSGHYSCIENSKRLAEIEDILHEFGVDLVITTQHDVYERTWPVYKGKRVGQNYINPRAPVHVTSAAFTCPAHKSSYIDLNNKSPDWSAYKHSLLGQSTFGMLTIHNRTHLLWQENIADENQTLLDHFYLIQTRHGLFERTEYRIKATTVILGLIVVLLVVLISGFLYLRVKAIMRRRAAERKMSYVNLTSSLEL